MVRKMEETQRLPIQELGTAAEKALQGLRMVGFAGLGVLVSAGEGAGWLFRNAKQTSGKLRKEGEEVFASLSEKSRKLRAESGDVFYDLVEKGQKVEPRRPEFVERIGSTLGVKSGAAGELVQASWVTLRKRLRSLRRRSGENLDERIESILQKSGIPTRHDIEELSRKIEELSLRLQERSSGSADRRSRESDWPLKMNPKTYLERYPEGPNANLARSIVGE